MAQQTSPKVNIAVSVVICALFMIFAFLSNHKSWFQDMGAGWVAATFFANDMPEHMYDAPDQFFQGQMPDSWADAAFAAGAPNDVSLVPYVYPPLWAALIAPVTKISSAQAFFTLSQVFQLLALVGAMFLVRRIYKTGHPLAAFFAVSCALLYLSLPSRVALAQNQPQILVTVLTIFAFARYGAGRSLQAGFLLAMASAIKLAPAAFILIFLFDRDLRAAITFFLSLVGFLMLSVVITGWDNHTVFLERVQQFDAHLVVNAYNHSLSVVWAQFSDWKTVSAALPVEGPMLLLEQPKVTGMMLKVVFFGFCLTLLFRTRGMRPDMQLAIRLLGLGIMLGLTAPVGWVHYYLLPILLLPCLLNLVPKREAAIWIGIQLTFPHVLFIAQSFPSANAFSVILPVAFWLSLFMRLCYLPQEGMKHPTTA